MKGMGRRKGKGKGLPFLSRSASARLLCSCLSCLSPLPFRYVCLYCVAASPLLSVLSPFGTKTKISARLFLSLGLEGRC